jgi:hypothetical protein
MNLNIELEAEISAGRRVSWVASTNRFHFPGWEGTAVGEGPSPSEALTALARELDQIATQTIGSPEVPIKADPLERVDE